MTIRETRFRYEGVDGAGLAGVRWVSDAPPRALLQLAHGAGEHSGRYRERLEPLVERGFVIYAADHRGHGLTSGLQSLGAFGPGGAAACVSDMAQLSRLARTHHPELKLALIGHSMGAMFAQAYLCEHAGLIDALMLSGTTGPGPQFLGDLNASFAPERTPYDWLSRDAAEVDAYIADPFCGIRFDAESMQSVLAVAARGFECDLRAAKPGMPVYVLVGADDPLNNRMAALDPLIKQYRAAGLDVTLRIYEGGRHELLNETNRGEVVQDLLAWLLDHV
jgi:alpha-beta hydrolase superfamily lysophospholipase